MTEVELYISTKYGEGTIIETKIIDIIPPSQIVTSFVEEYIGRLSIQDISYCIPEAEETFNQLRIGDDIKCVVLSIDSENKYNTPQNSDHRLS